MATHERTIKQNNRRWKFINQTKTSILRKIPFARKKSKKKYPSVHPNHTSTSTDQTKTHPKKMGTNEL